MTSIDIILPYFNGSEFIKEQIDSILNSNLEGINIRFVVVNDASNEKETKYLKSLLPSNSIYLENETNLGVIKSVEKGLNVSTGAYMMLCDHDDVWLPTKIMMSLQKIMEIENNFPALVFTDLRVVDEKLNTISESMAKLHGYPVLNPQPSILTRNMVTGCTVILNKHLKNLALPFPKEITMHDHWLGICASFGGKIGFIDKPLILYRQHGKNQIGARSGKIFKRLNNYKINLKRKIYMKIEIEKRLKIKIETSPENGILSRIHYLLFILLSRKNK